jgi:hypothetical protein
MTHGLFPFFGFVSAVALTMCHLFWSVQELQNRSAPLGVLRPKPRWGRAWSPIWFFYFLEFLLQVVLHMYHCFSMGAPRRLKQLLSFKRVSDILRHLLQGTVVPSDGLQDITTYTSTVECIPTVVARVIAILPRCSKSDQTFQNFPGIPVFSHEKWSRTGARQSFCQLFFPCNAWQTSSNELTKDASTFKQQNHSQPQMLRTFRNCEKARN